MIQTNVHRFKLSLDLIVQMYEGFQNLAGY